MNESIFSDRYTILKEIEGKTLYLNNYDNVTYLQKKYPASSREVVKVLQTLGEMDAQIPRIDFIYYDKSEDSIYTFEECIGGKTFREYLRTSFSLREGVSYFWKLVEAAYFLNTKNIIHRDLKPENVIIDNRQNIKIIDFNISRLYEAGKGRDTTLFGTAEYISPEQYGFSQTTHKSDIYALGKILEEVIYFSVESSDFELEKLAKCMAAFDPQGRVDYGEILFRLEKFLGMDADIVNARSGLIEDDEKITAEIIQPGDGELSRVGDIKPRKKVEDVWGPNPLEDRSRMRLAVINTLVIGIIVGILLSLGSNGDGSWTEYPSLNFISVLCVIYSCLVLYQSFLNLLRQGKIQRMHMNILNAIAKASAPRNVEEMIKYVFRNIMGWMMTGFATIVIFVTSILLTILSVWIPYQIIWVIRGY